MPFASNFVVARSSASLYREISRLREYPPLLSAGFSRQLARRTGGLRRIRLSSLAIALILAPPEAAPGILPKPEARAAFERYVALTDARNQEELTAGQLLWIDALAEPE